MDKTHNNYDSRDTVHYAYHLGNVPAHTCTNSLTS